MSQVPYRLRYAARPFMSEISINCIENCNNSMYSSGCSECNRVKVHLVYSMYSSGYSECNRVKVHLCVFPASFIGPFKTRKYCVMAVTPTHLPVCTVIVNFSFLDKLCSLHSINFKLGHTALRAAKLSRTQNSQNS